MKRCIKILSGEKGASAVEFAIILPILVMLVFGIIQFGLVFNKYIAITHAAREGARLAAVGLYEEWGDEEFMAAVQNSAPTVQINTVDVYDPEGIGIGNPVTVTVTGEIVTINIPPGAVGPVQIPLTCTATMRRERTYP